MREGAQISLEVTVDRPLPWLRFVEADKVKAPELFFDGMKVRNDAMDTLGSVAGFIVDNTSWRPYYVVVDSGGWFKSKDFLVPIAHARIDDDRDALVVNMAKDRIERFPGFDRDHFESLGEDDVRRMNDVICDACRDDDTVYPVADPLSPIWAAPEFTQPDWWAANVTGVESATSWAMRDDSVRVEGDLPTKVGRATGELQAEQMIAREHEHDDTRLRQAREQEDRDMLSRGPESSPHLDGRAQPGDVIGVETGGEQTHIGDTTEGENSRRIDAERDALKRRD